MRTVAFTHELAQVFEGADFSDIFKGRIRNHYAETLAGYRKTLWAFEGLEDPHVCNNRSSGRVLKQAIQQGRSE